MARIDIRSNGGGGSVATGVLQLQGGVAMTSTLTAVTDQSNTASPLLLSTTAIQITSPLRITTSDASGFYLDAEDSATNNRFSIKRDPSAQEVTLDFASNPSGSTTLVGAIRTYRDGINLSNTMSFIEDGSVGIGTNAPVGVLHLYKSAAATRLAIDGDAGQNRLISYRTGALQRFGLYVNNTAESGSNAGSNFAIRAYSDAGALLNTPFFINRATGNVGINTLTGTAKLQVVGTGATSATTALLVQNSSGNSSFTVLDNRNATFGADVTVAGTLNVTQDVGLTNTVIFWSGGYQIRNTANGFVFTGPSNSATGALGLGMTSGTGINASAILQADSTTKGFLPPRMTTIQKNAIASPLAGLVVYDSTLGKLCVRTASAWETITSV